MSGLRQALDDYLTIRRALGFKLERAGLLLADFVTHLEAGGADTITTQAALAWATLPPTAIQIGGPTGCQWCGALPATCMPSTPPTKCLPPSCCPAEATGPRPTSTPRPTLPR